MWSKVQEGKRERDVERSGKGAGDMSGIKGVGKMKQRSR